MRATVPDPTAGARTVCPKVVDTIRINSCKTSLAAALAAHFYFCLACSDVRSMFVSCTVGTCINSEVQAYQGTSALNTPVFVSSDEQVCCGNLMHCLSLIVTVVVACLKPALTGTCAGVPEHPAQHDLGRDFRKPTQHHAHPGRPTWRSQVQLVAAAYQG